MRAPGPAPAAIPKTGMKNNSPNSSPQKIPSGRPPPHPSQTGTGRGSRSEAGWLAGAILAAAALALAGLSSWLVVAQRRPRGTLVVWWGSRFCLLDPADVVGLARLEELFHAGGDSTGWPVS